VRKILYYLSVFRAGFFDTTATFRLEQCQNFSQEWSPQQRGTAGVFSVNSVREFALLPDEAYWVVTENRAVLQRLLTMNIEAESPRWLLLQLRRWCCPSSPDYALSATLNPAKARRPARSKAL
jgi:hypothetical protein